MTASINRRDFMGAATASGACAIVPRHVLGGNGHVAPSDKITLAHIGMGTQASANSAACWRTLGSRLSPIAIRTRTVTTTWNGEG